MSKEWVTQLRFGQPSALCRRAIAERARIISFFGSRGPFPMPRPDVSTKLIHFTSGATDEAAFETLHAVVREGALRPSSPAALLTAAGGRARFENSSNP